MKNTTLVFGASLKPARYAYKAIHALRSKNIDVKAFGLRKGEVADVTIETELKSFKDIDTITLYINPKIQQQYYDYFLGLEPNRVIFNPGTENPEFYQTLKDHNIKAENACTLVLLATQQYH